MTPLVVARYRKEAVRLRDKAEITQDPTIRAELLALARRYEVLAEGKAETQGIPSARCKRFTRQRCRELGDHSIYQRTDFGEEVPFRRFDLRG